MQAAPVVQVILGEQVGGKALSVPSLRLSASRYRVVAQHVLQVLRAAHPDSRIALIRAYSSKPDFGDMDVLVADAATALAPLQWAQALTPTEVVVNGNVISLGLAIEEGVFQIDLIRSGLDSFDFALRYFDFNDMGNLLGRIANRFGAKFGHKGLLYPLYDPANGQRLDESVVTTDFSLALSLLGYDAKAYEAARENDGFATLEDVFHYVCSTPYFHRDLYQLENLNNKARVRDAKRPTYRAFLHWLDQQPHAALPAFTWGVADSALHRAHCAAFLERALVACPDFAERRSEAEASQARQRAVRERVNGERVARLTGVQGAALGTVLTRMRAGFDSEADYQHFILTASDPELEAWIRLQADPRRDSD